MALQQRQYQYFQECFGEEKKEDEEITIDNDIAGLNDNHGTSRRDAFVSLTDATAGRISSSSSSSSTHSQKSVVSYKETEHARLRRQQRGIDKKDLQAAIRYGTRHRHVWGKYSKHHRPRYGDPNIYRYTYNDIHYIVNEATKEEITCYTAPVTLEPVPITQDMEQLHFDAMRTIQEDMNFWTSHTVMVIDTSGSMKNSDMWGSRNRLQGVWLSIALDFIAQRLESGTGRCSDVISIISMGGELPQILLKEAPTTWVLYNDIVTLYNRQLSKPQGHGYFVPSLTVAEDLLKRNTNASCAAALIFLSDGAPSDRGPMKDNIIVETVESLAKQFGRRLIFTTVGFGALEAFDTLQNMVDAAKDYGAIAELKLPGMTSSSLGVAFTSIATSLTSTQTELTEMGTSVQRKVREVHRESRKKASQPLTVIIPEDFHVYSCDKVKRKVRTEVVDSFGRTHEVYKEVGLQNQEAKFVAISKGAFGEGAERFAFRFYELAQDGKTIVGLPMVAKESRMVLDSESGSGLNDKCARNKFVERFIMTQETASRLAKKFNNQVQSNPRIHRDTPKIAFLDCSVYELDDKVLGTSSVLVERRLDTSQWHKWNSNNGLVNGMRLLPMETVSDMNDEQKPSGTIDPNNCCLDAMVRNLPALNLDKIDEVSEEDEDDDGYEEDGGTKLFTPSQVAQAFSHYSYHQTDCKRLVCDLQGVYDSTKHELVLSDPVIHYHNATQTRTTMYRKQCVHGRTDRGWDGIRDFFVSHRCADQGGLCQLVNHGFKSISATNRKKPLRTVDTTTMNNAVSAVHISSSGRRSAKSVMSPQQIESFLKKESAMHAV